MCWRALQILSTGKRTLRPEGTGELKVKPASAACQHRKNALVLFSWTSTWIETGYKRVCLYCRDSKAHEPAGDTHENAIAPITNTYRTERRLARLMVADFAKMKFQQAPSSAVCTCQCSRSSSGSRHRVVAAFLSTALNTDQECLLCQPPCQWMNALPR